MIEADDDRAVDEEIYSCLNLNAPKSFFLFAGAGSGKTRSLVNVLTRFRDENASDLRFLNKKIAVITYTNAACEEIKRRLEFDDVFVVSTIHSFSWMLIQHHQSDIRAWVRSNLIAEIEQLEEAHRKGRAGTKAAEDRVQQIASKTRRLSRLETIRKFSYNPNGENVGMDSLNHSEVIGIASSFIGKKSLLRRILINKYPVLLIDESQDTKKDFIEALQMLQSEYPEVFALGLFGDMMQRIYGDGKLDLDQSIPATWATPVKRTNYRCPKRIVELINQIRKETDGQEQIGYKDDEGFVRLFIADSNSAFDKAEFEFAVCQAMAGVTGDVAWRDVRAGNKTLTLEHHMAATRGGFSAFFEPLHKVKKFSTGLLDGSLPGISLFSEMVRPLVKGAQQGNQFLVMQIMRKRSPLLSKGRMLASNDPKREVANAKNAVDSLVSLWGDGIDPTLKDVVVEVCRTGIFEVPDILETIALRKNAVFEPDEDDQRNVQIDAWEEALRCRFSEFEDYVRYISEESRFGTHQGIKGLQFPRVLVILDDEEARGFMFSYDKLFGVKAPTAADSRNVADGKETSLDRTRRLFYVTCSRAESSLALIAYSKEPNKVRDQVTSRGWFREDEVIFCAKPQEFYAANRRDVQ